MDSELIFRLVDVTGVICNGIIGASIARKHGFDLIGFLIIGIASALGGGMLRDMLLGIGFPVALVDPWYLGGAITAVVFSYFIPLENKWWQRIVIYGDILALGCWSATGASKGLSAGLGAIAAIFLGVVTALFGGVTRDVILNKIPTIFGGNTLYATFAIFSATQMVLFQTHGQYNLGMAASIITCAIFSALARHYGWKLPKAYNLTKNRNKLRFGNKKNENAKDGRKNLRERRRQIEEHGEK